ncbi:MAG: hypothetical protein I3273_00470 [Candidatus Moeniiplasma glomeromycotorum]|nr:hypothetical protein [Candidatus Moeniiplasma glomeromycotorum]MCE8167400.1 hypothetical protein [Candidatus Moeniiplasma glomeromycotorum]MCE8168586.1 hypothetical protein [Candidatus Moeniiplasma glomeromycotorum]
MGENKDNFLVSLRKDLERELEQLKIEKKSEREKFQKEAGELIKKELTEAEKKNAEKIKELEAKLKSIYYWLFAIIFSGLAILSLNIYLLVKIYK